MEGGGRRDGRGEGGGVEEVEVRTEIYGIVAA